jgi:serine/threonine-protein kinase PpkA
MRERLSRRSMLAAALSLPAVAARAQLAPATTTAAPAQAVQPPSAVAGGNRPLRIPNKTTLYQRIVTHPGATLSPQPSEQGARPVDGFEVFYVYARQGGDAGWIQVGRESDGRIDGWIPAKKTIEWKQTLVGAFTNPAGRQPVLFLDNKDAERDLLLDAHAGDVAQQMLAAAQAGNPGHVIAREPQAWANIDEQFYLLPILSATPIERELGPPLRLLEVISAPAQKPEPPPQNFKAAVVFLVDTTMSMQPYIDGTREVIRHIVERIQSTPMGALFRFGLVAYRDSLEDTPALEYYARVYAKPDFSQPANTIVPAIAQVSEARVSSIGYDEDPIGGLKMTLDEINWNSFSPGFRHVILITDSGARPANHPHSVTRLGISEIKDLANQKGVLIWALHLQTQEGARRHDLELAARQYRQLTAMTSQEPLYFPVPDGPAGQFATQPAFENQADHVARLVITAAAENSHQPVPDLGAPSGVMPPRLAQAMPIIREAMRLAYLGHVQETTAPDVAVRSWATDRDLGDPSITSLDVRVLLTKNQLSDLAETLQRVLREGRADQSAPQDFFARLRSTVASAFRDPQQITQATQIGGLLGEYLDDLPYQSELLRISQDEWDQRTFMEKDRILNRIDSKLELYRVYNAAVDHWYDLGHSHNPGETVYPVPIEQLP